MSTVITTIPAIVRILVIFVLILMLIKRKWNLGNAFVVGALGIGLIFAMPVLSFLTAFIRALADPKTMSLSLVVSLILVLSHSLEKSGQMGRLLDTFKGLIRHPRINLVIFPALIGLLPMPGGAIFSAPMVKNLGQTHQLSASQLSYINYWFRHIWEYWWPLYPGVLLATSLANVDLWRLVFYTLPLTVVAVLVGYRPLIGTIESADAAAAPKAKAAFFKELAPIAFVVIFGLLFGQFFVYLLPHGLVPVAKELGLIFGLLGAIGWVWHRNAMGKKQCWAIIKQPRDAQNDLHGQRHPDL